MKVEQQVEVKRVLDVASVQEQSGKLLGVASFEQPARHWLKTGNPHLNKALGSRKYGIPFGRLIELRGEEHGGKTVLSLILASMGQKQGAAVGYVDLEESRDEAWATKMGLDYSQVVELFPKFVKGKLKLVKGKIKFIGKEKRQESAELLFEKMKENIKLIHEQGFEKQIWIIDSIAFVMTEADLEASFVGQNMRTRGDRAMFLSSALPKLAGLAANYNVMFLLINQIRDKPGVVYGPSEYSPGGRALRHTCQVRATIRRVKNGRIRNGGEIIGLVGAIRNFKNKVGKGSVQDGSCAFAVRWGKQGDTKPASVQFMSLEDGEKLMLA